MSNFIYFIVIYFLFNLNGFCSLGFNTQDTIYNSRTQLLDSITQYSENPDSIVSATNKVIDADAYPDAETNTITYYINDDTSAISYNEGNELVYKKTKEGIDYSKENSRERKPFSPPRLNVNEGIVKAVCIGVIMLLVLFVIYRLFRNARANQKINITLNEQTNLLDEAAENLDKADLDALLKVALDNKNFKAAVRIYYLKVLKLMWDKNILRWRKEKTNGDYLSEVWGSEWFELLKSSTYIFEKCWYGNADMDEVQFEEARNHFKDALHKLND